MKLCEEILELILLKQEGEYWDFKREWYDEGHEGDLLHDIICMANNLVDRDAFIIIGVDEENDYGAYKFDISKRRNTQQIVDFLRNKNFAGAYRPIVTVEHIDMYEYSLDVLIIHNSMNTPFYLAKQYKQVHSNNIYIRVQDSNTPVDSSADIHHVEILWKKRFGLLKTALEKVSYYLTAPEDWEDCSYDDMKKYYKYEPEFTVEYEIEDDPMRTGYEYYMINQTDNTPHWTTVCLRYHQTVLREFQGIFLDGGRYFTPVPDRAGFSLTEYSSWDVSYAYFVVDSILYKLHSFYYSERNHEERIARDRLLERILIFETDEERKSFEKYARSKWKEKDEYIKRVRIPYIPKLVGYGEDAFKEETINVLVLKEMLNEYRYSV